MNSSVDVLIVTYRPELGLRSCLESLRGQPLATAIVVVNNTAEVAQSAVEITRSISDVPIQLVMSHENLGFAKGVNLGMRYCSQAYVLILNDDATLEPGCLDVLISEMQSATPDVIGLAPKVLLDSPERVIDNVGAAITAEGSVYNRGYNQKDIGQFDNQVDVAGACFAATLLRREGFDPSNVGPLDSRYFMYAEDSDWCLRARLRGYRFVACPAAVVRHRHSLSSATLPSEFKWRLIRRNSMLTVLKCFPRRLAARVLYWYIRDCLRRSIRGVGRREAMTGLAAFVRLAPWTFRDRIAIRGAFRDNAADAGLFDPLVAAQPNGERGGAGTA
jgi:GT2 family glycosyltransferase